MQNRVTVLTTVYNGLPYLKECVDSVLSQTLRDFEFLIVDDGSSDGSVELIESFTDARIRFVKNERNMGQARSLNKGLALAEGEIIARLDQDDVCLPNRLAEQLAFLDQRPDVSVLCSWEITIDSTGRKVRTWRGEIPNYGDFAASILLGLCPVWHPSTMFRKAAVEALGNFDPEYAPAEDYELWSRIAAARQGAAFVPAYHLKQRVHDSRQSLLQAEKQQDRMRRAHHKFIADFGTYSSLECTAALLRREADPCGRGYERAHMQEIGASVNQIVRDIADAQQLTAAETRSLHRRIDRTLGPGVRQASFLATLPNPLYRTALTFLSPAMQPRLRAFATAVRDLRFR